MTRISVVGFDLDDTLWDVRPVIIAAEKAMAEWLMSEVPGFEYDRDRMAALRREVLEHSPELAGKITELRRRILVRALADGRLGVASAQSVADGAMDVFLERRNRIELFDGALDAIRMLGRDYTLGTLTNGNADIHRVGLGDHFDFAFTAEEVGAPKPHRALFEAALEHTSVDPHEMVYVGDDPHLDVDAANRVGLKTIWVRKSDDAEPGESDPDHIITHVRDLPAALRALQQG